MSILYSLSEDKSIKGWNFNTGVRLSNLHVHSGEVRCIALKYDASEMVQDLGVKVLTSRILRLEYV